MADVTGSQSGITQAFTRGLSGQILGHQSALQQRFIQRGSGVLQGTGSPYQLGTGTGSGGGGSTDPGGGGTDPDTDGTGVPLQLAPIGGDQFRITNFEQAWKPLTDSGQIVERTVDRFSRAYYVVGWGPTYIPPNTPGEPDQNGHFTEAVDGFFLRPEAVIGIDAIIDRTTSVDVLRITLSTLADHTVGSAVVRTGWRTSYERLGADGAPGLSTLAVAGDVVLIELPGVPRAGGKFGTLTFTAATNAQNDGGNGCGYITSSGMNYSMRGSLTTAIAQ